MKKILIISFLLFCNLLFSQIESDTTSVKKIIDNEKIQIAGDSIALVIPDKKGIIDHEYANMIDSLWQKKLINSPLYDTIQFIIKEDEILVTDLEELPTDLLKKRLIELDEKSPFHIEYNKSLEQVIKTYLKRRKSSFSSLMERGRYYFPMFEEMLDKYDIPLEMKYLAIVESALKPRAKSRVGATGLWQFMYQTGKQYNLNISSYVDERSDPMNATEAACKYLSELYDIFGDWDLALAAYNSGPGNVSKAIRRSGGHKNYWNIRHFLPRETAGYVPAFYATLYIFEYADSHNIKAKENAINYFETDTVQIKKQMTFAQIHETIGVDIELLQFLNPQYKLDIIPYIKGRNYTLTLPVKDIGKFLSNEQTIYDYVDAEEAKREKPLPKYFEMNSKTYYRVRSGDYLGKIAIKYGVSVKSIRRWNKLKNNNIRVGQRLIIYPRRM